ncbi:MAG: hypothetical protein ACD_71C00130G0012 [uncultured bacterium (gcode 4)]|uniref:Uncharacterized protein n=1 Tax=uncultured bacterium (gcode 4) TaxID=1234023 RepID=K1YNA3_9BACT|nr:MAG: hypothetical protein ACD_71C00130G0012 [uncultured bacterium (gcode 4)]
MIITKRDFLIFKIISELGFVSSDTIRKIISPEIQQKTFNLRLSTLKKEWFIKEISIDKRVRNQHAVYSLNLTKKSIEKIRNETWIEFDPTSYNPSYQLYLHQLYLWDLTAVVLWKLRKAISNFSLTDCQMIGSKSIQRQLRHFIIHPEAEVEYINSVMIPDMTIIQGKKAFLLELENQNSYQQFQEKLDGYEEMLLKKDTSNYFETFKGKDIQLIVATRSGKIQRYVEILKNYSGKRSLTILEDLIKKK